tara:strand:+ start:63 stop:1049 length:987 start_codon:yes stop_codon:yes gene_type:complete
MKKISLVTGCAGFIGSHMCDYLLKKKMKVYGIDNLSSGKLRNIKHINDKNFKFLKLDIKNSQSFFKKKKIDYIFHFAGNGELIPSIDNPIKYLKNNTINTAYLLDQVVKNKIKIKKFVYAASSTCYGKNSSKTNEKSKINIEHPYALSKYLGEFCVMHWSKIYKVPSVSIRIFNAYGTRSRTSNVYGAVIGVFLKQKISNYPLTIIGDGNQKRDFLYVTDVCEAFYKAAKIKSNFEIFNLGFGKSKSVNYLAKLISDKKIFIPFRPGEPKNTEANIKKISKILKWQPKVNLKEGMKNVLENINYWNKAPLWTKKKIKNATKNWHKYLK